MKPQLLAHTNREQLAAAAAARLVTRIVDVQSARDNAAVVLTGGGAGIAVLEHVRDSPARDAVDWAKLDIYWGDERFLPEGDPERNATQAFGALLDHVPVDPERVHVMAPSDGAFGDDPEAAAADYARILAENATPEDHGAVPRFDVLMLGVGPEGHVASVFPESPAVYETEQSVVAVRNCPKPPPTRISLTLPAIRHAEEVWIVTDGAGKAPAVAMALAGAGEVQLPAAGALGTHRTLWLTDTKAAGKIGERFTLPLA
ncbi:6-phosphogluconolactonase [Sciscionella marina]|uniref:6-phosphogluconolactonase n=1 Tax=Sciscionella marina TaxID=508770 RepID=UPI0003713460|nr:6-phosphogluconolactonase [Sciscionella marina]